MSGIHKKLARSSEHQIFYPDPKERREFIPFFFHSFIQRFVPIMNIDG